VELTVRPASTVTTARWRPAVHYLQRSYGREELSASGLCMLVTALTGRMNLVAKEYVATRHDERGALCQRVRRMPRSTAASSW